MNKDHKSEINQPFLSDTGASNPLSLRLHQEGEKTPKAREVQEIKGDGSIPNQGIRSLTAAQPTAAKATQRISKAQLYKIEKNLSGRDHEVLRALKKYRFLTSDQIGRLFVTNCSTKSSQTRNRNLMLQRLSNYGLIRPLERRIGGGKGGSSIQVWYLAVPGYRLLYLYQPGSPPRKAYSEPSPAFLRHTLAVAEAAVQLTTICRDSHDLTLEMVDSEPSCWRPFRDNGRVIQLKPDLFAVTTYAEYEDRWFIEIDLNTESVSQIVDKCNVYLNYYHTGIEQRETQMFPLVLWIVPDDVRKKRLQEYIRERIVGQPKMFLIITPDQLEQTLRQNSDPKELC